MAGLQLSGIASGMDTDSIIKDLMKIEQSKVDKVNKQKMKLEMKQDVWKEMNTKLYSFYTKQVFDLKSTGTYTTKGAAVSDETKISVSANSSTVAGVHTIEVSQLAKGAHLYSDAIAAPDTVTAGGDMSFKLSDGVKTETITLTSGAKINDLIQAINDKDLSITASYDSKNKRIFLNSTTMGTSSRIQFSEVDGVDTAFFTSLGFNVVGDKVDDTDALNNGAAGQMAMYKYDSVDFEADSNSVTINGLSLTLKAETTTAVNVNVTNNTDAVYNKIKDFIKAYNTLLDDMNTRLDADSNAYEPLTDTEKESLDDKTIEKWEAKIKEALLRRDDKLTNVASSMRSIVTAGIGVDTSLLSTGFKNLSDIGITTGGYTEKGKLHIEGDSEDSLYAINENKLKAALEENPDKVAELFTAIGKALYDDMSNKMKSTSLNSALTFYNDKQIKTQIKEYSTRMYTLEDKMTAMEARYRKQFTAMEAAIQNSNAKSSSLTSMLSK